MKQSITGAMWTSVKSKTDSQGRIALHELLPLWNDATRTAYSAGQQEGEIIGRIRQLAEIQELLTRGVRITT